MPRDRAMAARDGARATLAAQVLRVTPSHAAALGSRDHAMSARNVACATLAAEALRPP